MGLLTGKFDEKSTFPSGDFRQKWLSEPEQNAIYRQDLAKVRALQPLAREGRSLAQAALAFTLEHDAVTTVIPGAKDSRQVRANLPGAPLDAAERALIDRVTQRGSGRKIWPA
jgi:myo-inositol catabolism protein IolS